MDTFWPLLVQWLHILAGVVWVGGYAFVSLALWPALLHRPAPEARALFDALARPIGILMGTSAQAAFWLGLLRGTVFGPVRSFAALFGTPYGRTFAAAIVLTVAAVVYGATSGRRLEARVWDGDAWRPGAARYLRRSSGIMLALLGAIVACMVLMRFGL
ncbi:MAG TPA: hypothetical protein VK002_05890 [Rubricoccaceae bacterium]|jgi:uncharacterized membrane protein|nr:hypothetical protein [Rubricoccaceae bacterium]